MIKVSGIDFHWNHSDGGAFLEMWSKVSTSFFLSYDEIKIFLNTLTEALNLELPTDHRYSEFEIKLNNSAIYVSFDCSAKDEYHVNLHFHSPRTVTIVSMLRPDLVNLRDHLSNLEE